MADEFRPWNPSKNARIAIGLATLWPPVYFVLFMASIGASFFAFREPASSRAAPDLFKYIFPLHCFTMLVMFALMAVYIVHAFKSDQLRPDTRILWVIILFMGNVFAFPVYWWLYLRPSRDPASSSSDSSGERPGSA